MSCCHIALLWFRLKTPWSADFAMCPLFIQMRLGHLCPLALILLPYQNSSVIGAGGQNVPKPFEEIALQSTDDIWVALLFFWGGWFHLGWAQATCQTGPSCPTRLAARLWVPSFTSKILTDRSLEERNMWMSRLKATSTWNRWQGECHRNPSERHGSCPRAPCPQWTEPSPSLGLHSARYI